MQTWISFPFFRILYKFFTAPSPQPNPKPESLGAMRGGWTHRPMPWVLNLHCPTVFWYPALTTMEGPNWCKGSGGGHGGHACQGKKWPCWMTWRRSFFLKCAMFKMTFQNFIFETNLKPSFLGVHCVCVPLQHKYLLTFPQMYSFLSRLRPPFPGVFFPEIPQTWRSNTWPGARYHGNWRWEINCACQASNFCWPLWILLVKMDHFFK